MEVVDCEAWRSGWPAQPVNTWSALALVAAGLAMLALSRRRKETVWVGALLVGAGGGSVAFHGHLDSMTRWAHDTTLLGLLGALALLTGRRSRLTTPTASMVVASGAMVAVLAPGATTAIGAGVLAIAVLRELPVLASRESRPLLFAGFTVLVGALLAVGGRTDGVWCAPSSVLQPHAGWHVLAATAVVAYAHARGWPGAKPRRHQ